MADEDDSKIWTNGILACRNPTRCCLSHVAPCATTAMLAKKTGAISPGTDSLKSTQRSSEIIYDS